MREFRQLCGRTSERYWTIYLQTHPETNLEVLRTDWGAVVDGKRKLHGTTSDRPGPKGRPDTKAYKTAEENALIVMDRLITKKIKEGYYEVGLDGRPLVGGSITPITVDFGVFPLPKNLCFSKPRNEMKRSVIEELSYKNMTWWTRKYNGMMVIAQIDANGIAHLYSRRMDDLTKHFPHLILALQELSIPRKSVLLFEAFKGAGITKSEFLDVQAVMRSKCPRALDLQATSGYIKFYLFRVPVWNGVAQEKTTPAHEICEWIENSFADRFVAYQDPSIDYQFLFAVENLDGPLEEAEKLTHTYGYEGWVGYIKGEIMGEYSYSLHGKPDRPACTFKVKPEFEDDFIAYFDPDSGDPVERKLKPMGSWGSGKNTNKVGTMSLYQIEPLSKEEVYICEVGSGFSDTERETFTNPAIYPIVVTVKFASRSYCSEGGDTNALTHPSFVGIHPDKLVGEVLNRKLTM